MIHFDARALYEHGPRESTWVSFLPRRRSPGCTNAPAADNGMHFALARISMVSPLHTCSIGLSLVFQHRVASTIVRETYRRLAAWPKKNGLLTTGLRHISAEESVCSLIRTAVTRDAVNCANRSINIVYLRAGARAAEGLRMSKCHRAGYVKACTALQTSPASCLDNT